MTIHLRRWHVVSTVVLLALTITSTLAGLFRSGHYADAEPFLQATIAQDAVVLLTAVPVLAASLWYATRGSLRGYLVWVGSLAYMAYLWASYLFVNEFNAFFLVYVALLALSWITFVDALVRVDSGEVHRAIDGHVSRRIYAAFFALTGVGLAALWLSEIVPAILAGTVPISITEFGPKSTGSHALDLAFVVPSLLLTAVWFRRRKEWAAVFAGVLLVLAALLAPGITTMTVVLSLEGGPVTPVVAVLSIVPPVVGAGFAIRYLLAIDGRERERPADEDRVGIAG